MTSPLILSEPTILQCKFPPTLLTEEAHPNQCSIKGLKGGTPEHCTVLDSVPCSLLKIYYIKKKCCTVRLDSQRWHHSLSQWITLHVIATLCMTLHCITLHYILLHYIIRKENITNMSQNDLFANDAKHGNGMIQELSLKEIGFL